MKIASNLEFYRNENQVDILKVKLAKPLQIGESTTVKNQILT